MHTPTLFRILAVGLAASALFAANAPVPLVNNPLVPSAVAPGSGGFTLTVNGTGFKANSVVNWNGSPRATVFGTRSQLTATILAADVAAAGTASVTVTNPAPGGGTSNVAFFQVATPTATVAMAGTPNYPSNGSPAAIAAGDLNGDGRLDLVIGYQINSNPVTWGVAVQLGNGDGTFQAPATFATSTYMYNVVVGDFNNDGKPDLAVGEGNGFDILLGNGNGTFQAFQHHNITNVNPFNAVAGDFNSDGILDLAITGNNNQRVSVLLGNGDGTFEAEISYPLPPYSYGLVTGDFNDDGSLDLAVAGGNTGGVDVVLGNGDGSFQAPLTTAGPVTYGLTTADFNGDGILDVAAGGSTGGIAIMLGMGNGKFKAAVNYPIAQYTAETLAIGDFNGDGKIDLAVVGYQENGSAVFVLLGNGDGTFQPAVSTGGSLSLGAPLAPGDFNGDGLLDLANYYYLDLQTTVALSPGFVFFPPTVEGTTSPAKTVTLTNLGGASINVTQVAVSGLNASEYALSNDTCLGASVPPSGNCAIDVALSPTGIADRYALLSVTTTASAYPATTALSGNGTPIQITPAGLDFGAVKVGQISAQKIIRAKNISSATVNIQGIFVVGRNAKDFLVSNTCGNSLKPKTTCSIVVQFIPAKKGAASGAVTFSVKNDMAANPKTVHVSGTGT